MPYRFSNYVVILFTLTQGVACQSDAPPAASESLAPLSEEITLETTTGTLSGTLVLPGSSDPVPVALIVAGSGPTDRNGNSPAGVDSNYLRMMADSLAQYGIASVRYDKRGVAGSQAAAGSEQELRFDHYVDDAVAWVEQLQQDERLGPVAVLGHSEGALVGMLAAQRVSPAALVSLAGAARPADSLILDQLQTQPPTLRQEAQDILAELRQGRTVTTVSSTLQALFRLSVQPYLISWIQYDPSEVIADLSLPILIVQGTTDLQVPEAEGQQLADAQPEAQLVIVDGMNHVLKEAPADPAANVATYTDPALPLAQGLISPLVEFLKEHFSR